MKSISPLKPQSPLSANSPSDTRPVRGRPARPAPFLRGGVAPQVAGRSLPAPSRPNTGPRGIGQPHAAPARNAPMAIMPTPPAGTGQLARARAAASDVVEVIGRNGGVAMMRHPLRAAVGAAIVFGYGFLRPPNR